VFLSGKQFLEESNYEKAISYFKDAYTIDCSVHAMLPIIATAYERKGDKAEAIRALGEYLRRAPDAPDHEVIEHRIRNLRDQLAREQPTPPPPASTPAPAPPPAAPTTPVVAPPAPAAEPPIAAGSAPPPSATSRVPDTEHHSGDAAPWILTGIGGAAVAAGIVMLAVGAGDVSSAINACPNFVDGKHQCPNTDVQASSTSKQNQGYTLENAGGVVGGVGVAAALVGIIWGVTRGSGDAKASARFSPVVTPGYDGIAVAGIF
jgi:tetratricopeptide (TPR) repeat protein